MATSTWLEITFQVGMGVAALVGGRLIANESYVMLGVISAVATAICFALTYIFFGKEHMIPWKEMRQKQIKPLEE
jgi:predicted MFS family arabinose efflux permease